MKKKFSIRNASVKGKIGFFSCVLSFLIFIVGIKFVMGIKFVIGSQSPM